MAKLGDEIRIINKQNVAYCFRSTSEWHNESVI